MGELRRLASQSIPDGAGIRATVWKVLIAFLIICFDHCVHALQMTMLLNIRCFSCLQLILPFPIAKKVMISFQINFEAGTHALDSLIKYLWESIQFFIDILKLEVIYKEG